MSIMMDNNHIMEQRVSGGFFNRSKFMPSILGANDRTSGIHPCSSSSSSSIGMNSDDDNDVDVDVDDNEVESNLNVSTFDSAVDALEQALPIRRGISNFYNGKSKSFTSLAETASSSPKDLIKPENAYSRKRKNLLAFSLLHDKQRASVFKSPRIEGRISKKSTNATRSSFALAVAINNSEGLINDNRRNNSTIPSLSPDFLSVPPAPWRSFSLVDLQHCGVSVSTLNSNLCSPLIGKRTKHDEVS